MKGARNWLKLLLNFRAMPLRGTAWARVLT
jgi:hypothetical protein